MLTGGAPIRVRMEDISKSFGAIKSLDRVSLVLRAGEVLGLVGDNGAGKSTLSKILSGALVPDSGRIVLNDEEVRFASPAEARRQRVEMVYQDLALCDTSCEDDGEGQTEDPFVAGYADQASKLPEAGTLSPFSTGMGAANPNKKPAPKGNWECRRAGSWDQVELYVDMTANQAKAQFGKDFGVAYTDVRCNHALYGRARR